MSRGNKCAINSITRFRQTAEPVTDLLESQLWQALCALAPLLISPKRAAQMEAEDPSLKGLVGIMKWRRRELTKQRRVALVQALQLHGVLAGNRSPTLDNYGDDPLNVLPVERMQEFAHVCADAETMILGMATAVGHAEPDVILKGLVEASHAPDIIALLNHGGGNARNLQSHCYTGAAPVEQWEVGDILGPFHQRIGDTPEYAMVAYRVTELCWGVPRWELHTCTAKADGHVVILTAGQEAEARRTLMRVLSWSRRVREPAVSETPS